LGVGRGKNTPPSPKNSLLRKAEVPHNKGYSNHLRPYPGNVYKSIKLMWFENKITSMECAFQSFGRWKMSINPVILNATFCLALHSMGINNAYIKLGKRKFGTETDYKRILVGRIV
jgi:hypothetical protein